MKADCSCVNRHSLVVAIAVFDHRSFLVFVAVAALILVLPVLVVAVLLRCCCCVVAVVVITAIALTATNQSIDPSINQRINKRQDEDCIHSDSSALLHNTGEKCL